MIPKRENECKTAPVCSSKRPKPEILLLHGFGGGAFSWRKVKAPLECYGTVHSFDFEGFGKNKPDPNFTFSLEAQAEHLAKFCKTSINSPPIVIAHSIGAAICLIACMKNDLSVRRLIFLNPAILKPKSYFITEIISLIGLSTPISSLIPRRMQVKYVLGRVCSPNSSLAPDDITAYVDRFSIPHFRYALKQTSYQIQNSSVEKYITLIAELKKELHMILGEDDPILPKTHVQKVASILGSRSVTNIKDCGHIPHEENPDALMAALKPLLT